MELHGLHHVTAVTAKAKENLDFYTKVLGLRLVKKTVNQDDVSAYHLFYADKLGTPGTDMTFFDWASAEPRHGETDGILRTMFRVSPGSLHYWLLRLDEQRVAHGEIIELGGRSAMFLEDHEGQRLALVDDVGAAFEGEVWDGADIPAEHAIRGFYAVQLAVPELILIDGLFTHILGFAKADTYQSMERPGETVHVYTMDGGGPGKEVHVVERKGERMWALAGGVHHVAFRVGNEGDIRRWWSLLDQVRVGNSGLVDRFYFKSLYFRISDGILFELATDEPGFVADEAAEHLGERLALPPFLEDRRAEIEAGLKPLAS